MLRPAFLFVWCFGWCVVSVLFVFALVLVVVRVLVGGGGLSVLSSGFVFGLRWCSWLSVAWLCVSGVSSWALGLRGASAWWLGVAGGWVFFGFGVVVVVLFSSSLRRPVRPLVPVRLSPCLVAARFVSFSGGRCRVSAGPSPFCVVLSVSVPVSGACASGFSSSAPLAAWVLSGLSGCGWSVASLVPGSSSVRGGVCRFSLSVFVG